MKYACIARHHGAHPVRLMCRVLEVSPAGFYVWRTRAPSARATANDRLLVHLRAFHQRSDGTYGAPRILDDLRDDGWRVGQKRVARLMRQDGLVGRARPRGKGRTTNSQHTYPVAPNLLNRQFAVSEINQVWVSDITYVPTRQGWLYLATVLDLASRRCIGWAMRETLEVDLALSALRMALGARCPNPGLLHHSDRGIQYACDDYRTLLAQHGIVASMSNKGDCWDNAVAESFFATLELELIIKRDWHTRDDARRAIFKYIETWYNRQRRHSTLGNISPAAFEAKLESAA